MGTMTAAIWLRCDASHSRTLAHSSILADPASRGGGSQRTAALCLCLGVVPFPPIMLLRAALGLMLGPAVRGTPQRPQAAFVPPSSPSAAS
jgi:hypothetical protein